MQCIQLTAGLQRLAEAGTYDGSPACSVDFNLVDDERLIMLDAQVSRKPSSGLWIKLLHNMKIILGGN